MVRAAQESHPSHAAKAELPPPQGGGRSRAVWHITRKRDASVVGDVAQRDAVGDVVAGGERVIEHAAVDGRVGCVCSQVL